MKKSDIEKQLKKELSASVPSDFEAVWNKCDGSACGERQLSAELVPVTAGGKSRATISFRGRVCIAAAVAAALLIAAVICIVLLFKPFNGFVVPSQSGYFVIDVNPSVRVDYDDGGIVTLTRGLNQDGEKLLEGLNLEGLTYEKAADAIFDACELHGYFSSEYDDNAILLTASKDNGEKDEKITEEINKKFTQKFEEKEMKGVVISDVDNGKWQKEADKYGINGQKYELILRYLQSGGKLDEEQYETISVRELYALISQADKDKKDK